MMNKIRGIATCSLLLLLGTQGALAIDPFYADKARGWFWHEQMEEEAPPPKPQMPPPPAPAPQEKPKEPEPPKVAAPPEPAPFSVDWFQKNLKQLRNKAIDDPTPENVTAMLAAERVMRDKAGRAVQLIYAHYRPDRFKYHMRSSRKGSSQWRAEG